MPSGKRGSSKLRVVLGLVVCIGLLLAAVVIAYLTWRVTAYYTTVSKYATATAERENFLTASYGAEGRAVVENFETKWFTFESHKNPSIQSELATGPFLDYFGFVRRGQSIYDEPSWLDTKSATVTHVWVIEYSPERFKVVAHVTELIDEVTPKGDFIQSLPPRETCGVFVFVREDGVWKLADYFDATNPNYVDRDWREAPDWSRQIIGDLPNEAISDCQAYAAK